MKNDIRCLNTREIEIGNNLKLPQECSVSITSDLWHKFYRFWQNLLHTLLADHNEIQVWQKFDRHGNIYWKAYDPVTGKSFSSGSEADMCMWIEQLYRY